MPTTVSLLVSRAHARVSLSLRQVRLDKICAGIALVLCAYGCASPADAHTVVDVSTAAPSGLESDFLRDATSQFLSSLYVNPYYPGTYALKLFARNPAYNPPPPPVVPPTTLEAALALGATVYVYGFANGMTYQNEVAEGLVGRLGNLCQSATYFNLIETSTKTFNLGTCHDVVATIENQFFSLSLSTPTPIPPTGH